MRVPEEVIGLWRFREVGEPRKWAATFAVDGHYYDTLGFKSMEDCVKDVRKKLRQLKGGSVS